MRRRSFLSNTAIGVSTGGVLVACNQTSNTQGNSTVENSDLPNLRWRMVTSWPQSLDIIYGGASMLCEKVQEMSGGRFVIEPYAAGEIVPGLEVLDAVQNGTVECGHTASYYYIGKNPALAFGTTMPFGLTAQQQNAWYEFGGGLETMHKLYSDFNVINFPAGNSGTQMGGWFKREINSVSDLQGLKMRIPGLGGKVMSRLGVNVQVLPGGEIFLALDRGAIDAAEWIGPYDDLQLGLNKAASYYYYPGWWEPGATLELQVNKSEWEKLPKEYQGMLRTAAQAVNSTMLAQYEASNGEALKTLIDGGTQLVPYSQEILETAQKATTELYEEQGSQDATFQTVYQEWKQFREQINFWNQTNELNFMNFLR